MTENALVVSHPPLETSSVTTPAGSTAEIAQDQTAQLTVTSPIRVRCEDGAQIVICTITQAGKQPSNAVAKVFDALYYHFRYDLAPRPRDVMVYADMDYASEAAAYKRLVEVGITGSAAPKYYGSWTLRPPITSRGVSQLRPVRLLLMERLEGVDLKGLRIQNSLADDEPDAFHIPEDYRLEVLAQALDSYVRMLHLGVDHKGLAPRNVVLVADTTPRPSTAGTGSTIPRVVLINYNIAIVYGRIIKGKHPHENLTHPVNPM
jgi:hypothetical protein